MENTTIGPFQILEKLGTTRRQKVYRAVQTQLGREVALKFLSIPPNFDRKLALEKLNHEFQILKSIRHPNLVRSFGAGIEGEHIFWATELIDGESLASILSRRGRIAADQVTEYARQVALCLEYLHSQNLVHSKLTPDKLLIARDDTLHVADLRLNRSKKRRWDSVRHRDAELAAYLAPEQLTGYATNKSDLYSLGTIMYEMLTGHLPFPPDNIARMTRRKLEDSVESVATQILTCPIWLDKLVMQMIEPAARKRPHSAQSVRMALEEIAKIDATQRSAVDAMSGGFNPLHLNVDKTEARQLMKKSKGTKQKRSFNWLEFFALAGSSIALITVIIIFAWPPSSTVLMAKAQGLVESKDPANWSEARQVLSTLRNRSLSESDREHAEQLYTQAQRLTLVHQADRGIQNGLQSENVQAFVEAYSLEKSKHYASAYKQYQRLSNKLVNTNEEVFVLNEALAGAVRLEQLKTLPEGIDGIKRWLENKHDSLASKDFAGDQKILKALFERLGGDPDFDDLRESAVSLVDEWEKSKDEYLDEE